MSQESKEHMYEHKRITKGKYTIYPMLQRSNATNYSISKYHMGERNMTTSITIYIPGNSETLQTTSIQTTLKSNC